MSTDGRHVPAGRLGGGADVVDDRAAHPPPAGRRRRGPAGRHRVDRRRRQVPPRPAPGRERGARRSTSTRVAEPLPLGPRYRRLFAASTISNLGDGVGVIAYPWLASAITRNPLLIALVAVVQRLPWLLFTLPAGVHHRPPRPAPDHDRRQRRAGRAHAAAWPSPCSPARASCRRPTRSTRSSAPSGSSTCCCSWPRCCSARARCSTTTPPRRSCPSIVETPELEQANGRLYSAEMVANQFVGPPLAGAAPRRRLRPAVRRRRRVVRRRRPGSDHRHRRHAAPGAGTAAAGRAPAVAGRAGRGLPLAVAPRPAAHAGDHARRPQPARQRQRRRVRAVRPGGARHVGRRVRHLLHGRPPSAGVVGGWPAAPVIKRIGSGGSLGADAVGRRRSAPSSPASCRAGRSPPCCCSCRLFTVVLWNVITVSLRQAIIPDGMLGRVNSVYRFFGWGAIPIGALIGGLHGRRRWTARCRGSAALRAPWIVAGGGPAGGRRRRRPAPHDGPDRRRPGRRRRPPPQVRSTPRPANLEQAQVAQTRVLVAPGFFVCTDVRSTRF